jgi:hypothetical protein
MKPFHMVNHPESQSPDHRFRNRIEEYIDPTSRKNDYKSIGGYVYPTKRYKSQSVPKETYRSREIV